MGKWGGSFGIGFILHEIVIVGTCPFPNLLQWNYYSFASVFQFSHGTLPPVTFVPTGHYYSFRTVFGLVRTQMTSESLVQVCRLQFFLDSIKKKSKDHSIAHNSQ